MADYIVVHGIKVAQDFVPETFGRLTTIGPKFQIGNYVTKQVCLCCCGNTHIATCKSMYRGATVSCGCYPRERTKETHTKHGHYRQDASGKVHRTSEYEGYYAMLSRCTNPNNKDYAKYGGRGIIVYPEWLGPGGFERWLAHIGPKPHQKMTQDRIDTNGNYEPGNVRWATPRQQVNNTRANIYLTHQGKTQTLSQWAEEIGMVYETLYTRHKAGWPDSRAISTPTRKR